MASDSLIHPVCLAEGHRGWHKCLVRRWAITKLVQFCTRRAIAASILLPLSHKSLAAIPLRIENSVC